MTSFSGRLNWTRRRLLTAATAFGAAAMLALGPAAAQHQQQQRTRKPKADATDAAAGKVDAGGATVIDGRGMIVLPGFVETHWHMWNSLLRGMSGEKADYGYF